jgi:hypothetical protein
MITLNSCQILTDKLDFTFYHSLFTGKRINMHLA